MSKISVVCVTFTLYLHLLYLFPLPLLIIAETDAELRRSGRPHYSPKERVCF